MTGIRNKRISIIIPCFNEEAGLNYILSTKPHFIDEIIVVDNASTDNSVKIAKRYGAKIIIEDIKGYGRVLLRGLQCATGDIIIIIDGDRTYDTKSLEELYLFMENGGYDFVSGCRFPLTNHMAMPFINRLGNYFISWLIRVLFKINMVDSQSGLMVFKRGILDKISICNTGMGFSQEIKVRAWLNYEIKCGEKNISYNPRVGKVKFRKIIDGYKNFYDIFQLSKELRK